MDFTFVPQYDGQTPKKRRLAKACESCRARKKRCYHHPLEGDDLPEQRPHDQQKQPDERNGYQGISIRKVPNNSRFLSDLSPETRLLERTTTANGENGLAKNMDSVGIWVNRSEYESLVRERNAARGVGFRPGEPEPPAKLNEAQVNGLIDVYFAKIHPFLPLLEETEFREARANGSLPEPLLNAVCLVALKDKEAEQYFKTADDDWSPRHLCKTLHSSVKAAISTFPKQDKITFICLLGVVSMHNEGSDGSEDSSLYLMQAIHYCQTLGLHLSASFPARDGKHTKRLFWCLWLLDRFSSATHGRPLIAADNDIAIEQFLPGESDFPAFEILFRIGTILNQVIGYYRPGNPPDTTGWETQYPGFDEIVSKHAGWNLPPGLLSTLYIAYLTVTILSHRSKGTADFASTTPSYVRQTLAASQIIKLMSPTRLPGLHAMPTLPYAISLAMSVSYQHLRQDQLLHQQEDARADFEACFVILRELRKTWSSADAMSALSEKVVEELSRVPSLAAFRVKRAANHDTQIEDFRSACRHEGEAVHFTEGGRLSNPASKVDRNAAANSQMFTPTDTENSHGLFEGIDDIFGTYLDPNYPVNLDFLDGMGNLDAAEWTTSHG